jgi:hypothetical protein
LSDKVNLALNTGAFGELGLEIGWKDGGLSVQGEIFAIAQAAVDRSNTTKKILEQPQMKNTLL